MNPSGKWCDEHSVHSGKARPNSAACVEWAGRLFFARPLVLAYNLNAERVAAVDWMPSLVHHKGNAGG